MKKHRYSCKFSLIFFENKFANEENIIQMLERIYCNDAFNNYLTTICICIHQYICFYNFINSRMFFLILSSHLYRVNINYYLKLFDTMLLDIILHICI